MYTSVHSLYQKRKNDSNKTVKVILITLIGGNAWEPNPPKKLLTPQADFEEQRTRCYLSKCCICNDYGIEYVQTCAWSGRVTHDYNIHDFMSKEMFKDMNLPYESHNI